MRQGGSLSLLKACVLISTQRGSCDNYPSRLYQTPLTAGRHAQMPFLMELDDAVEKIVRAIEKAQELRFPWQLATIVRAGMLMPNFMYDKR